MSEAIRLSQLVKSFSSPKGPVRAVRGIDVTIERGETVALLGPNGAGKSTTIDMILGLLRPDAGSVSVLGASPREAVCSGLVGAMLQKGALIRNVTVREILSMVASLYRAPMGLDAMIELAGLGDIVERRTEKLSGGQVQRVRFAVALASNPELLILDEPTEAMDVAGRQAFWQLMRTFASQEKTIIFATHYLEEVDANADRVILMAQGKVVADGPTTEIKGRVGTRQIHATLPGVPEAELATLSGVTSVRRQGQAITLTCSDSDAAVQELFQRYPFVRDLEVTGAGLEDAFLRLTTDPVPETQQPSA
jgi:ABC-2 type transport system ATP-binding protein